MIKNQTFGQALEALKQGDRIAREGWNGKNMFLFLLPAGTVPKTAIHDPALRAVMDAEIEGDTFEALGSIRMFTADKKVLTGWLASQTDMLAEDWVIMDKEPAVLDGGPWRQYKRKGLSEMRPYLPGEDLTGVNVSPEDTPSEGDMIARNPNNHRDQWLVAQAYFEENLEPA